MQRRDNGISCPKCGGRVTTYMESESSGNGVKTVKYLSKCKSCGSVNILEELVVRRTATGLEIVVRK